ncbi:caspase family protein [Roseomonas sp. PWR1]|uniref:Caspase family protein n=1 Tax=Roseomonas nitratireducens TaxID=2820810 RepID=A0ABS4AWC3_9PROT|nr:caspase family protein [Neoroseomonas nitratireducens]MBP0465654.1 caspase family protein [Neoroseomonas nitratireducens]
MTRRLRLLLAALAALMLATPALAQPGARVALVVGAGAYRAIPPLANPPNDARALAATLTRLGFDVDLVLDPDRLAMEQAVRRLGQRATGADAALFFYAGHALEFGGRNWLLPVSTDIRNDRDLRFEGLDLDSVIAQLEGARVSIVLLDGCRDNPFRLRLASATRGIATGPGLSPVRAAVGTLIAFATAPGEVAEDGAGQHSPFTAALLRKIATPGLELRAMMAEVRREVREQTGGRQVPWEHSAMEGAFYFVPAAITVPAAPAPAAAPARDDRAEILFWETVRAGGTAADYRAYLDRFPEGVFAPLARARLAEAEARRAPPAGPALAALAPPPPVSAPPATPPPAPVAARAMLPLPRAAGELARALPHVSPEHGRSTAAGYLAAPGPNRALAINPDQRTGMLVQGFASAEDAETTLLERCQIAFGSPCLLVAVNDALLAPEAMAQRRDMPRLRHAGAYDPDRVPGIAARRRPQMPEVMGYGDKPGPKAMAIHPQGRVAVANLARSRDDAAQQALAACRAMAQRDRLVGSCLLYAIDDEVVLPRRLTQPPR